jgi:oligosaccharide repeat unit polymerase
VLALAKFWKYERSILCGALVGSIVTFLLITKEGIPLFNSALRAEIASSPIRAGFQVSSIFAAAYSFPKYGRRGFLILIPLSVMALLLGYKGNLVSIIIAALISGLISASVRIKEALSISGILLLALFLVGTFVAKMAYGSWKIPWFLYLVYRAGLTIHVYQEVAKLSIPFGVTKGLAMLDPTKKVITQAIGVPRDVGITATLIGPATLDFGPLGALCLSAVLGLCMRALHPSKKSNIQIALYSSSLARVITLLDIGIGIIDLSYVFSLLFLSLQTREYDQCS